MVIALHKRMESFDDPHYPLGMDNHIWYYTNIFYLFFLWNYYRAHWRDGRNKAFALSPRVNFP